jgi:hypothetical protein
MVMSNNEVRLNKDGKVVVCPLVFDTDDIMVSKENMHNPNSRLYFESELGGEKGTVNLFPSETGFDSGINNSIQLFNVSQSLRETIPHTKEEIIRIVDMQNCNLVKFYSSRFFNSFIQNSYIIFNNGILSFIHDYLLGAYESFNLDQQLYLTVGLDSFLSDIYRPLEFNKETSSYEYNNTDSYFKNPNSFVDVIMGPVITAIHRYINDIILNNFDVERFIEDSKANDPELEINDKHLYISYTYAITNQLIKADIDKLSAVTMENMLNTLENIALDYNHIIVDEKGYFVTCMRSNFKQCKRLNSKADSESEDK